MKKLAAVIIFLFVMAGCATGELMSRLRPGDAQR